VREQRRQRWWNSFSLESEFKKRQLLRILAFTAAYVAISSVCLAVVYVRTLVPLVRGELPPELGLDLLRRAPDVPGLADALALWATLMTGLSAFFAIVVGLYFSHKLAGPLYRFKLELGRIAAGHDPRPLRLRQGDDFQDVAEELNRALAQLRCAEGELRQRLEDGERRLAEVASALRAELGRPGDARALEAILAKLEEHARVVA
jgi:hypothetical protein